MVSGRTRAWPVVVPGQNPGVSAHGALAGICSADGQALRRVSGRCLDGVTLRRRPLAQRDREVVDHQRKLSADLTDEWTLRFEHIGKFSSVDSDLLLRSHGHPFPRCVRALTMRQHALDVNVLWQATPRHRQPLRARRPIASSHPRTRESQRSAHSLALATPNHSRQSTGDDSIRR